MDNDLLTPPVYKVLKQYTPEWNACFSAVGSEVGGFDRNKMREVLPLYDCESNCESKNIDDIQIFGNLHFHTESGYAAFCMRFF
jgi:hypothetical protein